MKKNKKTDVLILKFCLLGLGTGLALFNGADNMFSGNSLEAVGCLLVALVLIMFIRQAVKAGEWKKLIRSISDKELGVKM